LYRPSFGASAGASTSSKSSFTSGSGSRFSPSSSVVCLLVDLYAVLRYRRKGDNIPKQSQYHIPLELAYTVVPILIVFACSPPRWWWRIRRRPTHDQRHHQRERLPVG